MVIQVIYFKHDHRRHYEKWQFTGVEPQLNIKFCNYFKMELTVRLRKIPSRIKNDEIIAASNKNIKKKNICRKCVCNSFQMSIFDFPPIWSELRTKSQLCDGIVKCEDGIEFKIHRAILAAVSPYFKALFTDSINRDHKEATLAKMSIPSDMFQIILDYIYTGSCSISKSNVKELLKYADQYQILDVIQLCCSYLMDDLNPTNCLEILKFASQYFCKEVFEKGKLYIRHNFSKLLKNNNEFVYISCQHLEEILKDDELNIKSEESVFEAIKMWISHSPIKRKRHLYKLTKCIRLGTLNYEYVQEISKWHFIQEHPQCKEYLEDILAVLRSLSQEDDVDYVNNYLFRPRIPFEVVFAVGGWSAGSPTNFLETYDSRADKWLLCCDTDSSPRAYHGLCNLNGLIYMIGGFDGNEYFNSVRSFDPVKHKWSQRSCMYYPRCYVSVVVHHGEIYAMGGYNGRTRMSSAEKYDPEKNQWELIAPMQNQRSDASAATIQDKIYIVGGLPTVLTRVLIRASSGFLTTRTHHVASAMDWEKFSEVVTMERLKWAINTFDPYKSAGFNGQEVMNSAEVYDTVTRQWSYITQMNTARSGVSLISFADTLYAIGGFNGYTRLASGEKYTPEVSDGWTSISDMLTPRSNFATVILDDYIVVIGGFNDRFVSGSATINYVEYFDTEANEWYDAAPMNVSRSALSACVLHGLSNARDYTFLRTTVTPLGPEADCGNRG